MKVARWAVAIATALSCTLAEGADLFFAPAGCGSIQTTNQTPKWAWITIYDVGQNIHLDYGWMGPFATRGWRSGHYSCAGIYHVRAELKDAGGPNPPANNVPNIFDTRVRIDIGNDHDAYLQMPISVTVGDADPSRWIYKQGPPWHFWWSLNLNKDPPKSDEPLGELPKFAFTNTESVPVFVRVTGSGDNVSQCLQPGATKVQVVMNNIGPHSVSWTPGRCDASGPTGTFQKKLWYQRIDMTFPAALKIRTQFGSGGSAATFVVNNKSPFVASVSVSGGATACLAPNATQSVQVPPGSHDLTPAIGAACNSPGGVALQKLTVNAAGGTSYLIDLDPAPR